VCFDWLTDYRLIHRKNILIVLKKLWKIVFFCQNFVKLPPTLIIFGTKMAKRLKLCDVHSFSTSPNLRQCTAVLNSHVPHGVFDTLVQKRRETEKQKSAGLDETARELLEQNRDERDKMEAEIQELRRRNVSTSQPRRRPLTVSTNACTEFNHKYMVTGPWKTTLICQLNERHSTILSRELFLFNWCKPFILFNRNWIYCCAEYI